MSTTSAKNIHLAIINTYALLRERNNPSAREEAEISIVQAVKDCTSQKDVNPMICQDDWNKLLKWMPADKIESVQNHPLFSTSNLQWVIKKPS